MSLNDFTQSDRFFQQRREKATPLRYDSEMLPDIKVIGVGGGGCNAVKRMLRARIPGVTFVGVNTDAQALVSFEGAGTVRIGE